MEQQFGYWGWLRRQHPELYTKYVNEVDWLIVSEAQRPLPVANMIRTVPLALLKWINASIE